MILVQKELWSVPADILLVTTNATITSKGNLVMGAGAAGQAETRYSKMPRLLGQKIQELGQEYGVILISSSVLVGSAKVTFLKDKVMLRQYIGAFQVKHKWWESAKLVLIENSVTLLRRLLTNQYLKKLTVVMNFPGIGYGKLKREDVLPIIRDLPDSVTVCEYKEKVTK